MQSMWAAGAFGYVLKSEAPAAIVDVVRAAARGTPCWTRNQVMRIQRWQEEVEERWQALTDREREVAAGKSNREIAAALGVSARTVEFHVSNVLTKLGFSSRVEAAVWAQKHRLCK